MGTDAPPGEKGPFIGSGSLLQGIEGGKLIGRLLGGTARVGIIISTSVAESGTDDPLYRGVRAVLGSLLGTDIALQYIIRGAVLAAAVIVDVTSRQAKR